MPQPHGAQPRRDDHFFLAAQRWLHLHEVSSVLLVCQGQSQPLGTRQLPAIEVPGCLSELPLHRLVDLSLAGVQEVSLTSGSCSPGCEAAVTLQGWNAVADLLAFTVAHAAPARSWAWTVSPSRIPVDRRGLLGLTRQSSPPWPTHHGDADERTRLLTSLRAAGVATLGAPTQGVALLASGCTACGVCVQACPHDALSLAVDGTHTSLVHSPDTCLGEQQCVALCPVNALSVSAALSWEEVLEGSPRVLATLEVAVCERCQTRFPAERGARWCEPCRIRRSDPFGSHLPAAAIELLRARGHHRP
ncbi:MAG: ferredoxin family protein [Propionibacteriaceae bacterium]|nr:ferredoxin family protein [Propionibacteriaceae bacterium]